jgi:hypothetical protein
MIIASIPSPFNVFKGQFSKHIPDTNNNFRQAKAFPRPSKIIHGLVINSLPFSYP